MKTKTKNKILLILLLIYTVAIISYETGRGQKVNDIPEIDEISIDEAIPAANAEQGSIQGVASWYDYVLPSGWSSKGHFVCATRDFERKSYVEVTDLDTGKSVRCLVTDYGPDQMIHPDRVIDLSSTAFSALAPLSTGLIKNVRVDQVYEYKIKN